MPKHVIVLAAIATLLMGAGQLPWFRVETVQPMAGRNGAGNAVPLKADDAGALSVSLSTSSTSTVALSAPVDGGGGSAAAPLYVTPTGESTRNVRSTAVSIDTTRVGDCATTTGDGGTVTVTANAQYRCTVRSADMCINNGAAVTTCSATAVMEPNGMYVFAGTTEEWSFPAAGDGGSPVLYLQTPSGTGCLSCNLLTPQ